MKKYGFTFYNRDVDYFIETTQKNKTEKFIKDILQALHFPVTERNIKYLKYALRPAICETREISSGRKYYEIHGDGFGGCGSWIDDGKTIIIRL